MAKSSKLGQRIKHWRDQRELSKSELAKAIGRTPSYITQLENSPAESRKLPSVDTLAHIIRELAKDKNALDVPNVKPWDVAQDLMLSAINSVKELEIEGPVSISPWGESKEFTDEPEANSEVWIVSDKLAEATDVEHAEATARNIAKFGMRYSYFVPFSTQDFHWELALQRMEKSLGEEKCNAAIRVFKVCEVAVFSRLRISHPGKENMLGVFSIKPVSDGALFYPAPHEVTQRAFTHLSSLCELAEHKAEKEGLVFEPTLGAIQRLYPQRK